MSHIVNPSPGGGGGSGTVTSVAAANGIKATPNPITGAGLLELDINDLETETTIAAGDLLPFLDVSSGTDPDDARKITFGNLVTAIAGAGTPMPADCTTAPALLCLGGRTGTTNNPVISSTATGTAYGSAVTGEGLTLVPNSAGDGTGKIGLIDVAKAYVANNNFGAPSVILGPKDPLEDLAGVPLSRLAVYDNDFPTMTLWSDLHGPIFFAGSMKDDGEGPSFSGIKGRGGGWATRAAVQPGDTLFTIGTGAVQGDLNLTNTSPVVVEYKAGTVFSTYVSGTIVYSLTLDDGSFTTLLRIRPDSFISLGADDIATPYDRQVQIRPLTASTAVLVLRGISGQTADLLRLHDDSDNMLASISATGVPTWTEQAATPSDPTADVELRGPYLRNNQIVFQYNDAGTVRYITFDATQSATALWATSTTPP